MVSLKQLFLAAPLFLQGISAVSTSGVDLSARDETDLQSRDVNDFNLQARDFDAAVVPEDDDEPTIGLRFDDAAGLQARKNDPKKKCKKTKPKRGIELARRALYQAKKGTNGWSVDENEYVNAARLKSGDKITVPNLTGCAALFLWTKDNTASVFHILCGKETADGKAAAEAIKKMGDQDYIKPISATVKSLDLTNAGKVRDAVKEVFPNLPVEIGTYKDYGIAQCKAAFLSLTAGSKAVTETSGDMISRQSQ